MMLVIFHQYNSNGDFFLSSFLLLSLPFSCQSESNTFSLTSPVKSKQWQEKRNEQRHIYS